jgi:hypothetical protein
MNEDLDPEALAGDRSPVFARSRITLEPGDVLAYDPAGWIGAIVFVTAGEIELEYLTGAVQRFRRGDTLWLDQLPLRAVCNRAGIAAQLLAISRRVRYLRTQCPRRVSDE